MEFSVVCPNDGPVDVSLESVSALMFDGSDSVEVVFTCPKCGADIHLSLHVPNLLAAALGFAEMLEDSVEFEEITIEAADPDAEEETRTASSGAPTPRARVRAPVDETRIDRYCEYFRRQLASVDSVEAMLSEIDSGTS